MTQEDKDLLLKDLCARLPYNPMVEYKGEAYNVLGITHGRLVLCKPFMSYTFDEHPLVEEVKPYLRPMSSMTEEEYKEYSKLWDLQDEFPTDADIRFKTDVFDWFNKKGFDYRGLIPKCLAIDCTNLNIY